MALVLRVLMLVLLSGGSAEVVKDFELKCGQFFANGKSPTRFSGSSQYEQICQTINGVHYYATYYDTDNRIPVYSAYRFEGKMGCERQNNWYIEPQLDDKTAGSNMASEGSVDKTLRGGHQALDEDYEKSGYHRGHLAPVYQAESQSCAKATFTLTNAAPQNPSFNSGKWRAEEKKLAEYLEKNCFSQPVYIVTGVVPGRDQINKRVNVPSHFWSAFCCLDKKKCSESGGVIGTNEVVSTINRMDVAKLEEDLKNIYGIIFRLFQ